MVILENGSLVPRNPSDAGRLDQVPLNLHICHSFTNNSDYTSQQFLNQHKMSQITAEQCEVPKLLFAQDARSHDQQKLYIVVALSQRKQSQIMQTVGQTHVSEQPFPTWNLLGQALSQAFFDEPHRLRLKSTMELHHKDYLLFEQDIDGGARNISGTATVTESILEVDFGKQSDRTTWSGYWKTARPVVAKLVQNCQSHK